ncbi:hypothetical protein NLI96_g5153 [Meripilus lineatus]|uniref:Uncharacterized protein n=1 Tax=Meripilus lineatus TaxID=2056292 RepID=A0AAD5V877_9APHY|nr:hypothetical protein NLI96_g5153 [Physisporinus lineatus]
MTAISTESSQTPTPHTLLLPTSTPSSPVSITSPFPYSSLQAPSSSSLIYGLLSLIPSAGPITLPSDNTPLVTQYSQTPVPSPPLNPIDSTTSSASVPSASPFGDVRSGRVRLSSSQKGGIAGGSVTAGLLVILIVAATAYSARLGYVIASLASSLFGLVLFSCRRIIFVCDDPDLKEVQISLFLSIDAAGAPESSNEGSSGNQHLVWKEYCIGGKTKEFEVTVPTTTGRSKRAGQPKIGFGTINDNGPNGRVQSQNWELAPAQLLKDGTWERGNEDEDEDHITAENLTDRACRIAMGVSEKPEDPEAKPKGNFKAKSNLFLHAFRTGGCKAGENGDLVMELRKLDRLTPEGGRRIKDLDPITTFYVRCAGKKEEIKLQIGENRPEDVKKFRLEHGIKFRFRKANKKKKEDDTA